MMTMCSIITVSLNFNIIYFIITSYLTAGPTVEPTMRVSILTSRDTDPNVVLTLSFNVTFGPPSRIYCVYSREYILKKVFFDVRDSPSLSREVIRSYYGSNSQPDMTRVSVRVEQPSKENEMYKMYACEVTVEGHGNIVSGTYTRDNKGSGITTVTVTGISD